MAEQGGRQERDTSEGEDRGKTPEKWDGPVDEKQDGGDYPNYIVHRDRSGNVTFHSKSKNNEFISLQHRAGQKMTFKPDGAIETVAHRGRYDLTFGEHRSRVSGGEDRTVKGDSSRKTDGERNETTYQDTNVSQGGNFTASPQSFNMTVAENFDVAGGSGTMAFTGGMTMAGQGHGSFVFNGGVTMGSASASGTGDTSIGSSKNIAMASAQQTAIKSGGQASIMTKSGHIAMDSGGGQKIYLNSGMSQDATQIASNSESGADAGESGQSNYQV